MSELSPEHDPDRPRPGRTKQAADPFGDLLPDITRDETDEWGDDDAASRDADLLRDVPPHHG